ncbi:MAG: TIGR04255 family protein [Pseudomonadales bacterium]
MTSLSSKVPEDVVYPNQPLIEVAFELRFFGEPVIESRRHEFYEEIRAEYPMLYVPAIAAGSLPALQRYKFEREDGSAGVTLALNALGYFQKEYEGSSRFMGEIFRLAEIAENLFSIRRFSRIGWRYINLIPFTREKGLIPIARFFNNPPSLFGIESHEFSEVQFRASTTYEDQKVLINLQSQDGDQDADESLIFDIDVFVDNLGERDFAVSQLPETIDKLHRIARNLFEDSITDEYREFLKGETYG